VRELQGTWAGWPPSGPPSPQEFLTATTELGPQVLNYFELNQFRVPGIEQFVNQDLTVLLVPVTFAEHIGDVPIGEYIDVVERYNTDRSHVTTIDTVSIDEELSAIAAQNLIQREMIRTPVTVVVLIFVFGALVARGLPRFLRSSIGIALGIVTLIGQFQQLQLFIENMVAMRGFAIGIDNAFFIIERYREQRQLGYDKKQSIEIAGATSGKAVLFSGLTVILALIRVMLVPINIFFSLGLGAVIVVSVTMALTLLPAMLSLLGDRINWPDGLRQSQHPPMRKTSMRGYGEEQPDVWSADQ
jgi:RND superfamily putative drug exporter